MTTRRVIWFIIGWPLFMPLLDRINTNRWNRIRYTVWAPIYDRVVAPFETMRRRSLLRLDPQAGERILLVGAGTGKDLAFLPQGLDVLAVDLVPAMLERARGRRAGTRLAVMDGHALALPERSFDAVVLHLILAVIPDPVRCLREAARVLKPGGRIVIFDKFVRAGRPSLLLRLLNIPASVLGTELTRSFHDILRAAAVPLVVVREEPAGLPLFWSIELRAAP